MKRRMMAVALALGLLASSGVFAADELTAGEKMAVEALIKQFNDRSFAARQQAVDRLIAIGPKVVPVIEKTLAETTDNEEKLRCQMVLKGLADKYGARVAGITTTTVTPGKFGTEASKVTLKLTNAELDEVLQALAEQSGNKLVQQPDDWEDKTITLNVTDMPYWQALDEVCKQTGLLYTVGRNGGMTLVAAGESMDVGAYAGPFVVKVTSATRQKFFRRLNTRRSAVEGLTYTLNAYCEDRLTTLGTTVTVTKAVDPNGQALEIPAADPDDPMARMRMGGGGMFMRGMFGRARGGNTARVSLPEAPKGLAKIGRIEGTVTIDVGTGKKQLKIEDALGEGEHSVEDGDRVLKITRANRMRNTTIISLTQTEDGKEVQIPRYSEASGYGFTLVDPDGGVHRQTTGFGGMRGGRGGQRQRPGGADGQNNRNRRNRDGGRNNRNRRNRDAGGQDAMNNNGLVGGVLVEVQRAQPGQPGDDNNQRRQPGGRGGQRGNFMGMRRNTTFIMFRNLPEIEGKWTLVCTVPKEIVKKTFPFVIKDVPTP